MIVKISSKYADTIEKQWLRSFSMNKLEDIKVGKYFVVNALILSRGELHYDLYFDESGTIEAKYFDIVDNRISRYWQVAQNFDDLDWTWKFMWGIKPYVESEEFRKKIWDDRNPFAIAEYGEYAQKMYIEFANSDIKESIGETEGWHICPKCITSWPVVPLDEMAICPNCKTIYKKQSIPLKRA